mmetsp:Transcript_18799/g.38180  ORF Transcript_18799/g.38180 Transcript_18799/m.38180 type:complete len:228 (-) Transcript_18799:681-1364(-)
MQKEPGKKGEHVSHHAHVVSSTEAGAAGSALPVEGSSEGAANAGNAAKGVLPAKVLDSLDEREILDSAVLGAEMVEELTDLVVGEGDVVDVKQLFELGAVDGPVLVGIEVVEHARERERVLGPLLQLVRNHCNHIVERLARREARLPVPRCDDSLCFDQRRRTILPLASKDAPIGPEWALIQCPLLLPRLGASRGVFHQIVSWGDVMSKPALWVLVVESWVRCFEAV